jgi:hypothetical protein
MLQRIEAVLRECTATPAGSKAVEALLDVFPNGRALLGLGARLAGCRVRKQGGRLFACEA